MSFWNYYLWIYSLFCIINIIRMLVLIIKQMKKIYNMFLNISLKMRDIFFYGILYKFDENQSITCSNADSKYSFHASIVIENL